MFQTLAQVPMHVVSLEAATDVIKSLSIFLVIFWFLQKISLRREFNRQLDDARKHASQHAAQTRFGVGRKAVFS